MRWAVVLVAVTVLVYSPMDNAPFVYEDFNWVDTVSADNSYGLTGQWPSRNWTQWSYQAQADYGRANPRPYHLMNVVLHLVTGGWVYLLGRRFGLPVPSAAFASAIFLWHPLNVAAVAYVSARSDLWMTLSAVIAVTLTLLRRWWLLPLVAAACLLSGASKELGALSAVLVVWTWRPVALLWLAPSGLMALAIIRWGEYGVRWPAWETWIELASANVMGIWRVLWLMVVPVGMSIDPDPYSWPMPHRMVALAVLVACIAWVWRRGVVLERWALGWLAVALLPRVLMPTFEPIHDQHAYLAMVPVALLAGCFVKESLWELGTSSPS